MNSNGLTYSQVMAEVISKLDAPQGVIDFFADMNVMADANLLFGILAHNFEEKISLYKSNNSSITNLMHSHLGKKGRKGKKKSNF